MNFYSFSGALLLAALTVNAASAQSNCAETGYLQGNGGSPGGAVYFDMTLTQGVTFTGLDTHYDAAIGTGVGIMVYTTPVTYVGNETDINLWTLVAMDDGLATSAGPGVGTPINFQAPLALGAGTFGVALVSVGDGHRYTNGTGANQSFTSADGVISLDLGTATNQPFTGNVFSPRVWNGRFCSAGPVTPGTNYCGPAVTNSTGNAGVMSASGSASVANNDLVIEASDLPTTAFGFFITSQAQGMIPQPGGSQGVLCLGGAIGRYVGAGQIQNSGAAGAFDLALNLTQTPTPNGLVSVSAGETWNFQGWYRDSVGGMATSNFTDGLSVTFQ